MTNDTTSELDLISSIADRAKKTFDASGLVRDKIDWIMDIQAVHNSVGLKLVTLFNTNDFNFNHDLLGIANHLNRDTGKLEGGFHPRYSY